MHRYGHSVHKNRERQKLSNRLTRAQSFLLKAARFSQLMFPQNTFRR
jgi:hypothetical protein